MTAFYQRMSTFSLSAVITLVTFNICQAQPFCHGYNPEKKSWGMVLVSPSVPENYCPEGFAIVANTVLLGKDWNRFAGSCCPLPAGSLLGQHVFRASSCPDGYVVTGGRKIDEKGKVTAVGESPGNLELRCTRIDSKRYTLAEPATVLTTEPVPALPQFAEGIFGITGIKRTNWGMIPPELRYGVGRESRTTWSKRLCLGYPWGSILTEFGSQGCSDLIFRPLLPNKPSTPERCRYVENIYSRKARCVP